LAQTYCNFEYVLVDNCSSDGSSAIAQEYAARDSRIRVTRTERLLSQVENYNFALSLISRDSVYTKMVQADDTIAPTCLGAMVDVAERHPRVGIVSSYHTDGASLRAVGLPHPVEHFSGREICRRHLLEGLFVFGTPTSLMYRSDVVRSRQPFFSLGRLHEDTEACYEILKDWDFGFVHQVLTFLRFDERSISGRVRSYSPNILDMLILLKRYGRWFLSPSEYRTRVRSVSHVHAVIVGEAILRGRDSTFVDYHREGLATVGERLTARRLMLYVARALSSLAFSPWQTLRRLRARQRLSTRP
jgi:glycosyltransferase involved in cell wall biosynthesis